MLFDKKNCQNYKYTLEKCYHKSIIDTHTFNNQQDINVIANLNLFYIESPVSLESKFDTFSLIKTSMNTELSAASNLPLGKYFVNIKYESTSCKSSDVASNKETIVDLSLLPIAIRAQLIFECGEYLSQRMQTYKWSRLSNTAFKSLDLPSINMFAIDSYLVQIEINKKRDEIIRESLVKTNYDASNFNNSMLASNFDEMLEFETFMKALETELNSYYLCEKVVDPRDEPSSPVSRKLGPDCSDDLVKLNKLDALASYKCVQKYNTQFSAGEKETKQEIRNSFFLIDNGYHYKCVIPLEDLKTESDSGETSENQQVIFKLESCHIFANYGFLYLLFL